MRKNEESGRASARSTERLRGAVLALLDERGPDGVRITDVVAAAGVTRPTFYAAFGDLPTAFADAALGRLEDAFAGMTIPSDLPAGDHAAAMHEVFAGILRRLEPHASFYADALRGPGGVLVQDAIVGFLAERLRTSSPVSPALAAGPLPAATTSLALAAGLAWTMRAWLEDEDRMSTDDLAAVLRDLFLRSVRGGLGGTEPTTPEENLS